MFTSSQLHGEEDTTFSEEAKNVQMHCAMYYNKRVIIRVMRYRYLYSLPPLFLNFFMENF